MKVDRFIHQSKLKLSIY